MRRWARSGLPDSTFPIRVPPSIRVVSASPNPIVAPIFLPSLPTTRLTGAFPILTGTLPVQDMHSD